MQGNIPASLPVWGRSPPGGGQTTIGYHRHRRTGRRNGRLNIRSATVEKDVGCARLFEKVTGRFYMHL